MKPREALIVVAKVAAFTGFLFGMVMVAMVMVALFFDKMARVGHAQEMGDAQDPRLVCGDHGYDFEPVTDIWTGNFYFRQHYIPLATAATVFMAIMVKGIFRWKERQEEKTPGGI